MYPNDLPDPSGQSVELYPSDISVDVEGEWFFRGAKIVREDILQMLLNCVRPKASVHPGVNSAFCIEWKESLCSLEVADTPFVIASVNRSDAKEGENPTGEKVLLTLKHLPAKETLDPATLYVGKDNVLYCRIREGRFPARFSRPAYYQLAEWIEEEPESGGFYLELSGKRHLIQMDA